MKHSAKYISIFLMLFMAVLLLRTAWVSEDAYITLRTVDNFINGYGLTWNVSERVQAYTHPLWMFALSGLYVFTREGFYTSLVLSLVCSLATFWLVIKLTPRYTLGALAGISILFFSKAYIDFSTSGLENPGTHLLLALFLWVFLQPEKYSGSKATFWLAFLAGLAVTNRMDSGLLFLPALALVLWQQRNWATLRTMLFGFLPFILWEIFSIIYYGFPFPNTAYAKLHTGLERMDLLEMGYLYFLNSIHWDPITLLAIGLACAFAFSAGDWREKMMAGGVGLYLFYVLWIGADYMSGRFFTAALLIAVILLSRHLAHLPTPGGVFVLSFVILLGMTSPTPTLTSIDDDSYSTGREDVNQISDERSFYFQPSGLLYDVRNFPQPFHDWAFRGIQMQMEQRKVVIQTNIGFVGYFAGRTVFIIDTPALADPLLARLTPKDPENEKPGHYERAVPDGYFQSVKNNQNKIKHAALAEYYEKLRMITRGPIWDWERFVTIWMMNTGQYDHFIHDFENQATP